MSENGTIDLLVFDLDDTLYPERSHATAALGAVAQAFEAALSAPFPLHARMCELFDTPDRQRVFDVVLAELGRHDAGELIPQMLEVFRAHRPVLTLHADAAAALARWSGRVPLGMVTDGLVRIQQNKLDALGIAPAFASIVMTGQWGPAYHKPHRRGFDEVQRQTGANGARCVYVADNLSKDFVAPRQMGWRTVHVARPDGLYADLPVAVDGEPDARITSLDQLDAVLEA